MYGSTKKDNIRALRTGISFILRTRTACLEAYTIPAGGGCTSDDAPIKDHDILLILEKCMTSKGSWVMQEV